MFGDHDKKEWKNKKGDHDRGDQMRDRLEHVVRSLAEKLGELMRHLRERGGDREDRRDRPDHRHRDSEMRGY